MSLQTWITVFTVSLLYFANICTMRDHHLCNFTEWKLVEQEHHVTKKLPGVLNKGDGGKQEVLTEVVVQGGKAWYNVSYVVEDCCNGYERRGRRDKCKACKHRSKTYGRNCSLSCQCEGCTGCDHVTGECNECEAVLTTSTTTVTSSSATSNTTTPKPHVADFDEDCDMCREHNNCITRRCRRADRDFDEICDVCREHNNCTTWRCRRENCDICQKYNNCTSWRCKRAQGRTDDDAGDDNSTTILVAVISSLGTLTIVLVIIFLLRERRHRLMKKKRLQSTDPVKFTAAQEPHEYVDPEPLYQEILDDDLPCIPNGDTKKTLQKQHSGEYHTPSENMYQPPSEISYLAPGGGAKDKGNQISEDESGYLNPYSPLRFARSETNLCRDKKLKEQGQYDSSYCLAKATDKDDNSNSTEEKEDENKNNYFKCSTDEVGKEEEKLIKPSEHSSPTQERVRDVPVYFILEKARKSDVPRDIKETESLIQDKDSLLRKETQI